VKRIDLPNRVTLEYAEQGDPTGLAVVLLHGLSDSWRSFEGTMAHLPLSLHALAITQRGHGDSDRPEAGYEMRDFGDDVVAFMDELHIPRAMIVGHSMGARVATQFALDHPERVRGLVLVGAFAPGANAALHELEGALSSQRDSIDPEFAREFQVATLAKPVEPAFLDMVVAESLKMPIRVWRAALSGMVEANHSGLLERIASPTLMAWGERDEFVPREERDDLAVQMAGARVLVYAGTGHALHWEEPARFASDLADFATRT
jgi:pimeloyl-ACP methyl ester carboxylesterase